MVFSSHCTHTIILATSVANGSRRPIGAMKRQAGRRSAYWALLYTRWYTHIMQQSLNELPFRDGKRFQIAAFQKKYWRVKLFFAYLYMLVRRRFSGSNEAYFRRKCTAKTSFSAYLWRTRPLKTDIYTSPSCGITFESTNMYIIFHFGCVLVHLFYALFERRCMFIFRYDRVWSVNQQQCSYILCQHQHGWWFRSTMNKKRSAK